MAAENLQQQERIPFNKPYMTGNELHYIAQAHGGAHLAGDGTYTRLCHKWLEQTTSTKKALLTHSCTAALEMAALLLDIKPGDEVIMPSYTFVSTANAFVLRGAVPVFVDVRSDTLNLDEKKVEGAITKRTKAIVPVHYAGVGCEMDDLMSIAERYQVGVVEDAAQAIMAKYKGRPLGVIGHLGAYSFHETKNVICGEGGALLVNSSDYMINAEIIREKGTDRSRFFRGEVDKYTWRMVGSSFLPSELTAAFLWAQLEQADGLTSRRLRLWNRYHEMLAELEVRGLLRRPIVPEHCDHNGHLYYVLLAESVDRQRVLSALKEEGIDAVFHYVPLHMSPYGRETGRSHENLGVTENIASRLVRLPLWLDLADDKQDYVVDRLKKVLLKVA
ncbi:dTDP-4-amino-4,6-dideoxygalactose transaminase [Paraburkholderia sp. CNPSo 3272]|uniref:dTDP-4-amino-4,6-dideoxygalactose transaminase n=1 Tax=Paraburkholderia sp. CNPSo 3272 TaxID=2940931 RepID=UPI0020B81045|nr:dTDP-4-amino-4,6-dideoxygalactose transaminase [Paraburkholderia sp. CNPSo 3272]MCP3726169.1 dTDP-4-amino-4,6-dideoxygalactose transaminase [Paraburkholderia sp. CNPSo 3272]